MLATDRLSLDATAPEEQATPALLERSESLEGLVVDWIKLVRQTGRERMPGQLEKVLSDLGPVPEAGRVSARALWVAGLINPLPALGGAPLPLRGVHRRTHPLPHAELPTVASPRSELS